MSRLKTLQGIQYWTLFLILPVWVFSVSPVEAGPPFSEGSKTLTLRNASQTDTLQYGLNENVTIEFTTTEDHNKVELTIEDYRQSKTYLDKADMKQTENGDQGRGGGRGGGWGGGGGGGGGGGTYTYSYTFNTGDLFDGDADWYYFKTDFNSPNAEQKGYLIVGNPGAPHGIRTYSDASYAEAAESFGPSATIYVEVVGRDNGETVKTKKVKVADFSGTKLIEANIGNLNNNEGVFRFSVDLGNASPAFTTDWWYTLEVEITQEADGGGRGGGRGGGWGGGGSEETGFFGYKQIQILVSAPGGGKSWTQQKWREVD